MAKVSSQIYEQSHWPKPDQKQGPTFEFAPDVSFGQSVDSSFTQSMFKEQSKQSYTETRTTILPKFPKRANWEEDQTDDSLRKSLR